MVKCFILYLSVIIQSAHLFVWDILCRVAWKHCGTATLSKKLEILLNNLQDISSQYILNVVCRQRMLIATFLDKVLRGDKTAALRNIIWQDSNCLRWLVCSLRFNSLVAAVRWCHIDLALFNMKKEKPIPSSITKNDWLSVWDRAGSPRILLNDLSHSYSGANFYCHRLSDVPTVGFYRSLLRSCNPSVGTVGF